MNAHLPISHSVEIEMTAEGEIHIPQQIRVAAGLIPGARLVTGINARGEVVIMTRMQAKRIGETVDQRRLRIRAAIDDLAGAHSTGQSTAEIMEELRGPRES